MCSAQHIQLAKESAIGNTQFLATVEITKEE